MGYKTPFAYTIEFRTSNSSPADSTDYYIGSINSLLSTSANIFRHIIPKTGRITAVVLNAYSGNNPTAENVVFAIRKNNTTDYPVKTIALAGGTVTVANYSLDIPVTEGDTIELKMSTPAWVTNPTSFQIGGLAFIEVAW